LLASNLAWGPSFSFPFKPLSTCIP
jgi:hypothetical protein